MRRGLVVLAVIVALVGCRTAEEVTRPDEPATTATTGARPTGTTSANPEKKTRLDQPGTTVRGSVTATDLWDAPALADLEGPSSDADTTEVTDDTRRLRVRVPASWSVDGDLRTIDDHDVPSLYAAEDQQAYSASFDAPGIGINLYPPPLAERGDGWALDRLDTRDRVAASCEGETTAVTFEGDRLSGGGDVTGGCRTPDSAGARPTVVVHLVLTPTSSEDERIVLQAQLHTRDDLDALEVALETLLVTEPPAATTTTASIPPMTPVPGGGASDAVALVTARVRACGFDALDARASEGWDTPDGIDEGPGKWTVTVRLSKAGQDYGTTHYVVNVDQGAVYSEGPIAKEYCP